MPLTNSTLPLLKPFASQNFPNRTQHVKAPGSGSHVQQSSEARPDSILNGGKTKSSYGSPPAGDVNSEAMEEREKALSLKMQVLPAFEPSRAPPPQPIHLQQTNPILRPTLDDTGTLSFGMDDSYQANENPTVVFRGQSDESKPRYSQEDMPMEWDDNVSEPRDIDDFDVELGEDWQEHVQAEREFQKQQKKDGNRQTDDIKETATLYKFRNEYPNERELIRASKDTPTRSFKATPAPTGRTSHVAKSVSFRSPKLRDIKLGRSNSPELVLPNLKRATNSDAGSHDRMARDDDVKAQNRAQHVQPPPRERIPQPGLLESLRASDYPTSSEDELPPPWSRPPSSDSVLTNKDQSQSVAKRDRNDDLDYDVVTLKRMKYEDLVEEEFNKVPEGGTVHTTLDTVRDTTSLCDRLEALSDMSEDEQRAMFHKYDDDQWTQTGLWFVAKFQEDLKRLVAARFEKRKTSMKFENEIRQRQKDIEWHSAAIDTELKGLKVGGDELIRGRDIPSRRGTPLRK